MRYMLFVIGVLSLIVLSGCQSEPPAIPFSDIDMAVADAGSGQKLFNQSTGDAPTCASCHVVDGSGGDVGPALDGMAELAENRVDGQSAEEYLYWSILRPGQHLVPGYSNLMYADYEDVYGAADIADLIAYLLTLD